MLAAAQVRSQGCSAVVQSEHQGDQETDEWIHLQPVEWRKGAQAITRNSAETWRRRGEYAVRSGITVSFHRWV